MKQILQSLKDGTTAVEDVPAPGVRPGQLLIGTAASLVSAGTERMLVDFGRANLLDKARQQPDKVVQVLDKIRTDGLVATLKTVQAKLDKPIPLGYSSAGVVLAVGEGVEGFAVGDRVVSNGSHAEVVCVPANLCARIPDGVDDETASFTVVSAIALQGIRLAAPTLGETVVVIGLGLIGLITVQILRAGGCRVIGIDLDAGRAALARDLGAVTCVPSAGEDPLAVAARETGGSGVDAVLITAATDSDEPMHQAAQMCRKRGRIVLVGVTGLKLSRADFYEKELTFQVSCSYGPGRYDPAYEQEGHDYPIGFVRWTEQRNFAAVLGLMAAGSLTVRPLVSHRVPIAEAPRAYDLLAEENPLGIVLTYPGVPVGAASAATTVLVAAKAAPAGVAAKAAPTAGAPGVSVIGAGNYASQVLLPALAATPATLRVLVSAGGVSGVHAGRKHRFAATATDARQALDDPATSAVVIATRHDSHARYVIEALGRRKHVFVEKPLAIRREEVAAITAAWRAAAAAGFEAILMPGFNRRFAPHVVRMKQLLAGRTGPKALVMTVNAGAIPPEHWTQDPAVGGGRIIGEACHFVDLCRFLTGSPIVRSHGFRFGRAPGLKIRDDNATLVLEFQDGSLGTIHYLAGGHRSLPKERLEVFSAGAVLQLDNFRRLRGYGWPGFSTMNLWRQDKGNAAGMAAFVAAVAAGGPSPIPLDEAVEVTLATFDAVEAMHRTA
ncbi:MAG: bi-domain-containing oxidoreductase [Chromatiales bacterium]|nr:bi-domain-containing oxidoreductase [Chromatiales bacterium]